MLRSIFAVACAALALAQVPEIIFEDDSSSCTLGKGEDGGGTPYLGSGSCGFSSSGDSFFANVGITGHSNIGNTFTTILQRLDDLESDVAAMESDIAAIMAGPAPVPAPVTRRTTLGFVGVLGPDKTAQGWSQCWGYDKNTPAHWPTAMSACGDFENVVFAGERCDGEWVEFPMDLKAPLSSFMNGGGRTSPQQNVDTTNIYNIEWSAEWWVLTKGGWNDGVAGTARCWEPHMGGATGANDGHVLDQSCRGNSDSTQQRHCDGDKYYVYARTSNEVPSTRPRFDVNFVGAAGPDKTAQGMTQCFGFGKDHTASWTGASSACGAHRDVVFAGYRCDGTWVEFPMMLKNNLGMYMEGGGLTSPQTNIDTSNVYNMEWSSEWWVLTKGGWNDGAAGTARCWEPHMAGATGANDGHVLDQQCRGNSDTSQQRHCDQDLYFVYYKTAAPAAAGSQDSCAAYLSAGGADGKYVLSSGEEVQCKIQNGKYYTLTAVVSSSGGSWQYGDADRDSGDLSSAWESASTFGSIDNLSADYKSSTYSTTPMKSILITYNGAAMVQTENCHVGESMQTMFNNMFFDVNCPASATGGCNSRTSKIDTNGNGEHSCGIISQTPNSNDDALLDGESASQLYLKWGEADGAEDGNKDRTYISTTARGADGNRVDYNQGLGSFVSFSGSEHTVNVGTHNDGAVSVAAGSNYGIWIEALSSTTYASCAEYRTNGFPTGTYDVTSGDRVHCFMDGTEGYTLVATVSSTGSSWQYGDANKDDGDINSAWESAATFGSADNRHADYKSPLYNTMTKNKILITYNGEKLLETATCHAGESMKTTFNNLKFNVNCPYVGGSDRCTTTTTKTAADAAHQCSIASYATHSHDSAVLDGQSASQLYLKWGEADGAEDGNKDRTYISTTARGADGNRVDYNQGLGSFVSFSGSEHTVNVGKHNDGAVTDSNMGNYGIYII